MLMRGMQPTNKARNGGRVMRSPIFNRKKERRDGRRNADVGFGAAGGTGERG